MRCSTNSSACACALHLRCRLCTCACPALPSAAPRVRTASFSWKGQAAAISQLLGLLISHAADPSEQLLRLATEVLPLVPDKVVAKQQLDAVAGYAALCSATFLTWYK